MNDSLLIKVAVPRPLDMVYTYRVTAEQAPSIELGSTVTVPFGRSVTRGVVVELPQPLSTAEIELEKIRSILELGSPESVIPKEILTLCSWAHEYYQCPLGEVLGSAVSPKVFKLLNSPKAPKKEKKTKAPNLIASGGPICATLSEDQLVAMEQLEEVRLQAGVALLHGVTGSGKTELYLELARRTLAEGKSVLLLVPEIALTPQLHARFEAGLGVAVGLWHSAVADGKRALQWRELSEGALRVVVGARSAIFAPMKNLGLIVVDEEHDTSYKQEDRVRYHARDLAIVRSRQQKAAVVLGSATPCLESLERCREGRYRRVRLGQRYGQVGMPTIETVDLTSEPLVQGTQALLAERTVAALRETLQAGQQAMVFLNRRGFSAFLLCEECGFVVECPNCSISLTYYRRNRQLRCHLCAHFEKVPERCAKCDAEKMAPKGAGTESLEDELPVLIPEMVPLRLDRDQVTSATRLGQILDEFRNGHANTLLGTQMLVKGHDFPKVTLVVVILADALFRWPDFRAPERALQLLTQVSGRAGRGSEAGKVLIQTYAPDHPVLQVVLGKKSEDEFLENERELRLALTYPPFGRLARLRLESSREEDAHRHAQALADFIEPLIGEAGQLLGPSQAFLERVKGIFRWDLLIKSGDVNVVQRTVKKARFWSAGQKIPLLVDIDPSGIG